MYFDIETTGIKPEHNKIILIGLMDDKHNTIIFEGSEKEILLNFNAYITKNKPSILAGHNVFNFDIPFIIKRCEVNKIKPLFRLIKENKTVSGTSFRGKPIEISLYKPTIKQISIIDTWILVNKFDFVARKLKSYNLKNAVIELGLRKDRRLELTNDEIQSCYKTGDIETIKKYLIYDLEDTKLLADKFLPEYYYQLSLFKNINLQSLCLMGNATKWNILISEHYINEPKADERVKYEGGLCIANKGFYKNCAKLDVESLYPSIMLNYKVCSRKDTKKVMLKILRYLTTERLRLKQLAKQGDKEADHKQKAMKVLINSAYGFLGTAGIPFNDFNAAAKVTAYGREILNFMMDIITDNGGGVICEADTDGVIYSADDNLKIFQIVKSKLPHGINIDLEFEAKAVLVLGKKNYIVLTNDDDLIIKGKLSNRERFKLEKEFYINYIKHYLESPNKAEDYYNSVKESLINRSIDTSLLTYDRVIKRGEKKLVEAGLGKAGDRVRFYYGSGKIPVTTGEFDLKFYLNEFNKMKREIDSIIKGKKTNQGIFIT